MSKNSICPELDEVIKGQNIVRQIAEKLSEDESVINASRLFEAASRFHPEKLKQFKPNTPLFSYMRQHYFSRDRLMMDSLWEEVYKEENSHEVMCAIEALDMLIWGQSGFWISVKPFAKEKGSSMHPIHK